MSMLLEKLAETSYQKHGYDSNMHEGGRAYAKQLAIYKDNPQVYGGAYKSLSSRLKDINMMLQHRNQSKSRASFSGDFHGRNIYSLAPRSESLKRALQNKVHYGPISTMDRGTVRAALDNHGTALVNRIFHRHVPVTK